MEAIKKKPQRRGNRVTVYIPDDIYEHMKEAVKLRESTMSQYIIGALHRKNLLNPVK